MTGTLAGRGILTNSIALRSGLAFESPRPVREDRREVRVAARAGDLKHIFLIAGPSGSGKSTIMSEFVYDRLPKAPARGQKLAAHERQRAVAGRASAHPSAPCPHARPRGPLRYHAPLCQTLRALRQRSSHQRADRIRCGADSADLAPNREVLLEQFLKRAADRDYVEWWDRRRWTR